ncbi:MAG: GH3 auxin-responsive promoter family protein [Bacteroidota bacterium]
MKGLINEAVKQYLGLRMKHRIEDYMLYPEKAQEQWLKRLIYDARATEFGKKYGFDDISNADTFRERVPAHHYDDLKQDISRMMHGEKDVLWPGEVNWYSKSSGTTSDRSKFIPVPQGNLYDCHVAGAWDSMALLYHNKPDMQVFRYKNLIVPGSHQPLPEFPRTRTGDVSAILVSHMPAIGRMFYTPDFDVALQSDFEDKLRKTADIVSQQDDIAMFGGVPTWLIVLFRMVLEKTGKSNLLEVWPNLQAYMHGGVGFEPYRETFRHLIPGDDFVYQEIYNASEGYFGAQCDLKQSDMLLLADNGVFYEFVPMEYWEEKYPKTLLLHEVEPGEQYAVMISSNNGLWRYLPGDTVVFTRKYPFCFRIAGRTQQFINAFGEEVMVGDADKALAQACRQLNVIVSEYTAAPVYIQGENDRGGHEWVIEFEREPDDLERFNEQLDLALQRINSDYEAKRFKGLALDKPRMKAVPKGTFMRWMRARGRMGSQGKIPRLANHRRFVEEVVKYQSEG